MPKPKTGVSDEEIALSKAIVRIADRLEISQRVLALVLGVSEPAVSRMRDGSFILGRGRGKAFELARLLLQVYDGLHLTLHGDEEAAKAWLLAENSELGARPIDLIQSARGLVDVVGYLRGRSSL